MTASKLFREEYQPQPFCYPIRRPQHYPEGIVSIEMNNGSGALNEHVYTSMAWSQAHAPMHFHLDASTRVTINGDRYLHAWGTVPLPTS